MNYYYKSHLCTFFIIQRSGRSELWVKDRSGSENMLGTYPSAVSAADDVYMCATGFDHWDDQMTVESPADLSEWIRFSR